MTYTANTTNKPYNHSEIETKWQKVWEKARLYQTPEPSPQRPKKYILDMYPYPSGETLHVGHMEGYVATDVVSRYLRMNNFSVLHPMGWDAFGLPAENYAIKTGIHPDISTHKNIETFKKQLNMLSLSYDWNREIDTSSPDYYKWTQWLFILLFKMGLAYKAKAPANWCNSCETVLANEQVEDGKCERCGTEVVQKELDQWFFKITAYADQLIAGLDKIDWPDSTKAMQKNWIGKKEGELIKFGEIEIFTTRPETILGATFVVLSPKHKLAGKIKTVINPATNNEIPVFVDEYVLDEVGTGAIMGVPAYDDRDLAFAKKNNLPVIKAEFTNKSYGKKSFTLHLRDWLVSRQRYWGAPIPMVYCEKCRWQPVPESELPILLPKDTDFQATGESPIARSKSFQNGAKCSKCGGPAIREVDTMDTFVDSSWYFLRFLDPQNTKEIAGKGEINKWMNVDIYVGGGHTVQHLLFSRFFQKALVDAKIIAEKFDEPFQRLVVPGWILGPDSRKMSKRWNNVITPDDVVKQYGADTMRLYEMFMAPFGADKPWNMNSVAGVYRFVNRIFRLAINNKNIDSGLDSKLNKLIKKVGEDIIEFKFNTAVSSMMEFVNCWEEKGSITVEQLKKFLIILAPFAPHLTEELWSNLSNKSNQSNSSNSIHLQKWPEVGKIVEESAVIAVMVNGKLRSTISVGAGFSRPSQSEIEKLAKEKICHYLENKQIKKVVFVPGKVINFVV